MASWCDHFTFPARAFSSPQVLPLLLVGIVFVAKSVAWYFLPHLKSQVRLACYASFYGIALFNWSFLKNFLFHSLPDPPSLEQSILIISFSLGHLSPHSIVARQFLSLLLLKDLTQSFRAAWIVAISVRQLEWFVLKGLLSSFIPLVKV